MPRRPQMAATIPRARRAPTPAGVEPPSSRAAGRGGWSDCRRCVHRGSSRACREPSPRIELGSTLAARALRPLPRAPPPSARRGGRAVPPRARPAPRVRPGAGVASPRCRDSHARSCACGVLAWRRRSGLSGKGTRSCADGAVPWAGGPGAYACICATCGARVVAASAGQDGAGDHGTREHMSKTLQSGRVRWTLRRAYTSTRLAVRWGVARRRYRRCCPCGKRRDCRRVSSYTTAVVARGSSS
jgi:hypothetical protein